MQGNKGNTWRQILLPYLLVAGSLSFVDSLRRENDSLASCGNSPWGMDVSRWGFVVTSGRIVIFYTGAERFEVGNFTWEVGTRRRKAGEWRLGGGELSWRDGEDDLWGFHRVGWPLTPLTPSALRWRPW